MLHDLHECDTLSAVDKGFVNFMLLSNPVKIPYDDNLRIIKMYDKHVMRYGVES